MASPDYESAGQGFLQEPPTLGNMFERDNTLRSILRHLSQSERLGRKVWGGVEKDLCEFGEKIEKDLLPRLPEMEHSKPSISEFDSFGRRINALKVCREWREMHRDSAINGLIHIAYHKRASHGSLARLWQFAKLHLFSPNSGMYGCPLAMTDGAAKLMETVAQSHQGAYNDTIKDSDGDVSAVCSRVFQRLTTNNPERFWTSGRIANDESRIVCRWFSSATDADVAITIARDQARGGGGGGLDGDTKARGNRQRKAPLSCFLVKVPKAGRRPNSKHEAARATSTTASSVLSFLSQCRDEGKTSGGKPSIWIARLKDKLGTRQLPTAELELNGAKAIKISKTGRCKLNRARFHHHFCHHQPWMLMCAARINEVIRVSLGRGIGFIARLVNITRLHNCVAATGNMAKATLLARDYACKRAVFGSKLSENLLHLETLGSVRCLYKASLHITFESVLRQGKIEVDPFRAEEDVVLLRLLTPLAKLYTAKLGVYVVNECMECIGGVGYMEDSGFPRSDLEKDPPLSSQSRNRGRFAKRTDRTGRLGGRVCASGGGNREGVAIRKSSSLIMCADLAMRMSMHQLRRAIFCAACMIEHAEWSSCEEDLLAARLYVMGFVQDNGKGSLRGGGEGFKAKLASISDSTFTPQRRYEAMRILALGRPRDDTNDGISSAVSVHRAICGVAGLVTQCYTMHVETIRDL
eukprot:jgi/Bigna1/82431/fgenesh1_pg.92_\